MNAICVPLGDHDGHQSSSFSVNLVTPEVSRSSTYMLRSRSSGSRFCLVEANAIRLPLGDHDGKNSLDVVFVMLNCPDPFSFIM